MKKIFSAVVFCLIALSSLNAQTKTDSVIINVGQKSKVIFAIGDKADLQTLKQYNFQAVVDDLVAKLEQDDSSKLEKPADNYLKTETPSTTDEASVTHDYRNKSNDDWDRSWDDRDSNNSSRNNSSNQTERYVYRDSRKYYGRRTHHSFNFDLGINNFMTPSGSFPNQANEKYSVRPWGSWYVGINSIERTRLARKFFLEWGFGVSWYNFKFEDDKLRVSKDDNSVIFSDDQRDVNFVKSKLTATYLNASLVPVLDFGGRSRRPMIFDGGYRGAFRIGVGPYAGYRIDSYSKIVYKDNGDKQRDRDHDNYYLNNLRYGVRLQVGFGATDLFFNYDLNEVFATNKGPKLHAFSFGLTF
jgi:hypothetical protein